MKQYKYAIFDLDGTLLDSMYLWRNLASNYLLQIGIIPPENLNELIDHMSMEEASEYLQKAFNIKLSTDEIIIGVKKLIENKYKYDLKLKPYVKEYLQKLKEEQVTMCVATASSLKLAKAALERNDVIKYFSFVLSCDELGVGKNKPDIYYDAAKKLGALPTEIAVYEDAQFALITAKEAGFYTIGVYDKYFKDKRKDIESISHLYIESFKEMMDY